MGEIYSDELKDYFRANKTFEDLLRRYPLNDNRLQIYYKLYTIAKNNKDVDRVSIYQQKIINEFPGSTYAKLMTNPNYVEELKNQENQVYAYYEETLKLFQAGNYSDAESRSEKAMKDYPGHVLFSKFDYLYTISSGLSKDTVSFVTDMQNFISKYPQTELAENAQILINYLQNKHPEIIEKQNLVIARELYVQSFQEIHYFAYIVPTQINLNQLIFNIINYDIDNVDSLKLEVKKVSIGTKNNLCMVSLFKNSNEAMAYFRKITSYEGIFRDIERQGIIPVVISETNFNKISETGKVEQYVIFFRENYK